MLRGNWQSATITYCMRIIVWFIFPQLKAAGRFFPLPYPALFFTAFLSEEKDDSAFREV